MHTAPIQLQPAHSSRPMLRLLEMLLRALTILVPLTFIGISQAGETSPAVEMTPTVEECSQHFVM